VRQAEPTKNPLANLALLAPWRRSRKWITWTSAPWPLEGVLSSSFRLQNVTNHEPAGWAFRHSHPEDFLQRALPSRCKR
jgi:hypothetical protein